MVGGKAYFESLMAQFDKNVMDRVPHSFVENDYKGYLEDRRPNSQGCPYRIASQILKTISEVSAEQKAVA